MIKIEELRKGSIVSYNGNIAVVKGTYSCEDGTDETVYLKKFGPVYHSQLEPVPITLDWLQKNTYHEKTYHNQMYRGVQGDTIGFKLAVPMIIVKNYIRDASGNFDGFYIVDHRGIRISAPNIKYVHQLQNIFLALICKDLPITL